MQYCVANIYGCSHAAGEPRRGCINDVHNLYRLLTETYGWPVWASRSNALLDFDLTVSEGLKHNCPGNSM
jgi:hypothetical protein